MADCTCYSPSCGTYFCLVQFEEFDALKVIRYSKACQQNALFLFVALHLKQLIAVITLAFCCSDGVPGGMKTGKIMNGINCRKCAAFSLEEMRPFKRESRGVNCKVC